MKPVKLSPLSSTEKVELRLSGEVESRLSGREVARISSLDQCKKEEYAVDRLSEKLSCLYNQSRKHLDDPQDEKKQLKRKPHGIKSKDTPNSSQSMNKPKGSQSMDTILLSSSLKKKKSVIPPISNVKVSRTNQIDDSYQQTNDSFQFDALRCPSNSNRVLKSTIWTRREIMARAAEERMAKSAEEKAVKG